VPALIGGPPPKGALFEEWQVPTRVDKYGNQKVASMSMWRLVPMAVGALGFLAVFGVFWFFGSGITSQMSSVLHLSSLGVMALLSAPTGYGWYLWARMSIADAHPEDFTIAEELA
jgi:hypothetical protein